MSPSIHPLPSVPRPAGAVALPSGLGAGGKGKEKAPCRYLHYEVDISTNDNDTISNSDDQDSLYEARPNRGHRNITRDSEKPQRTHRIEVGLGPVGKGYKMVIGKKFRLPYRNVDNANISSVTASMVRL
jgi:mRNA (2'-O-methyladenosine-N6-)-methyltransferase